VFTQETVLAINVALVTGRPLLVRGTPGNGKSTLAEAIANILNWRFLSIGLSKRTQAQDLLWYRVEDTERPGALAVRPGVIWDAFESEGGVRAVVRLSHVDRAMPEVVEELIEVLDSLTFRGPSKVVAVEGHNRPLVVLTSGEEHPVPGWFSRRCIDLFLASPDLAQLEAIAVAHGLGSDRELVQRVAYLFENARLSAHQKRLTAPTTREYLDALKAVRDLGVDSDKKFDGIFQSIAESLLLGREEPCTPVEPALAWPRDDWRPSVFLCHSSGDKDKVRPLYERLRYDGLEPWLDEVDILPGADWDREIRRAVRRADLVVVCLSKSSVNKSGYLQREIRLALDVAQEKVEGQIYIIPALLESCDVPERLRPYQWVKLYDDDGYARLLATTGSIQAAG